MDGDGDIEAVTVEIAMSMYNHMMRCQKNDASVLNTAAKTHGCSNCEVSSKMMHNTSVALFGIHSLSLPVPDTKLEYRTSDRCGLGDTCTMIKKIPAHTYGCLSLCGVLPL